MTYEGEKEKYFLNYPQILLIGFGFFASSLAWAIYNSQVPLMLSERFFLSGTLIGTIITIDNFFGVIFQPLIGAWSDNTRTRFGRPMPWILFGLPVCERLFALISPPQRSERYHQYDGWSQLHHRFFLGDILSDIRPDKFHAFLMATLVMVFALIILFLFIREPTALRFKMENKLPIRDTLANRWSQKSREDLAAYHGDMEESNDKKQRSLTAFLALSRAEKTSLVALLFAIFAWFLSYNAIETFFTLYARNTYSITGGQATMMLTGFSLTFLIFAVPAGLLTQKIGRKRTILIGLIGIIVLFLPSSLEQVSG